MRNTDLTIPMKSDIPDLLQWFNDEEVTRFLRPRSPILEPNEVGWLEHLSKDQMSNQVFIIATKEGKAIGTIGLHRIDWISRTATLGIAIGDKSAWGKGHGTEAMILIVQYGLKQLNLHKIELDVHGFNGRAIACYKRCGFFEEGKRLQHTWVRGQYHDTIQMGIFRRNFEPVWKEYLEKNKKKMG